MSELKKRVFLPKLDYYKTHLSIVNCFFPVKMTPMEISVLAAFMAIDLGEMIKYRFDTTGRRIVMEQLGIKASGLSNYIGDLTKKGFLIENGNNYTIWPILHPQPDFQEYRFRLDNTNFTSLNQIKDGTSTS